MSQATRDKAAGEMAAHLERIVAKIAGQVIAALGKPDQFQRVDVRLLWDDRYRANILVGASRLSVEILHSFFVTIDGEGIILASLPKMVRLY